MKMRVMVTSKRYLATPILEPCQSLGGHKKERTSRNKSKLGTLPVELEADAAHPTSSWRQ